jgi:hypothetical protein
MVVAGETVKVVAVVMVKGVEVGMGMVVEVG